MRVKGLWFSRREVVDEVRDVLDADEKDVGSQQTAERIVDVVDPFYTEQIARERRSSGRDPETGERT